VGAVLGIALAVSGGSVWRAQTIVYLGQPFAPLGGGQIQSLATNPRTVGEIIARRRPERAEASGIPVSASIIDLDARAPRSRQLAGSTLWNHRQGLGKRRSARRALEERS
jgi:hypothetical protein